MHLERQKKIKSSRTSFIAQLSCAYCSEAACVELNRCRALSCAVAWSSGLSRLFSLGPSAQLRWRERLSPLHSLSHSSARRAPLLLRYGRFLATVGAEGFALS